MRKPKHLYSATPALETSLLMTAIAGPKLPRAFGGCERTPSSTNRRARVAGLSTSLASTALPAIKKPPGFGE